MSSDAEVNFVVCFLESRFNIIYLFRRTKALNPCHEFKAYEICERVKILIFLKRKSFSCKVCRKPVPNSKPITGSYEMTWDERQRGANFNFGEELRRETCVLYNTK